MNKKFEMFKRIFVVSALGFISLLLIGFIIGYFIAYKGYYNDGFASGFDLDEQLLNYFYAALAALIPAIVELVYFIKNEKKNMYAIYTGLALPSTLLLGYYARVFFKPLNKSGTEGFVAFNMIVMLAFLALTIYFWTLFVKYIIDNNKKSE